MATTISVCPNCGATNAGTETKCKICGAELSSIIENTEKSDSIQKPIHRSNEETKLFLLDEQTKYLRTIKNCVVFFTVLAVIGIIAEIVFLLSH